MSNAKAFKNGVTTRFSSSGTTEFAATPITVRLEKDIDAVVRQLPNRSAWLQRVIAEAVRRELMGNTPAVATEVHRQKTLQSFREFQLNAGQRLIINGYPCTMRGWIGEEGNEIDVRFDHKVSFQGKSAAYHARIKAREVERLEKRDQ
jgi:hypothetical protein